MRILRKKKHSPSIKRTKLVVFWFVVNIERFYFDRSNAYMIMVKLIEIHSKSHFEYDFGVDQTHKKKIDKVSKSIQKCRMFAKKIERFGSLTVLTEFGLRHVRTIFTPCFFPDATKTANDVFIRCSF